MPPTTCPDRQSLQSFLLGKTPEIIRGPIEQHLSECQSCAAAAETLVVGDDLTEALERGARSREQLSQADDEALAAAIQQAKGLASLLDTQANGPDATAIVTDAKATDESADSSRLKNKLNFLAPAQQADELGRLGDYRVLKVLGVGGMGMVFKAEDIRLGRLVALKVMRPGVASKPQAKERFLREARATAAISHDHVVQIHQVGEDRGVPFIAMQYLAGQSLQTAFTRLKKLRPKDVARIGKEVALGLAAAHEKGLIHRDIKPDNIWIEAKTHRAKILDFGLARDLTTDEGLTQSGTILGTPRYMAPEQVTGGKVDHRADLFSLGSMLYHLASGKPAFAGANIAALLFSITQSAPQPLDQIAPQIDPSLADWIMRLLSKDPEHRPQSTEEVAKRFASIETTLKTPIDTATVPLQPIVAAKPKSSQQRQSPSRRWPVVAAAGAAAFALILGVIAITIRGSDGKETTIRVTEGTTTTLDLAPGSDVTIQEEAPESAASDAPTEPPALAAGLASNADTSNQSQLTEEELFPPLEKWLEGRKQLTVAQDGSAMFTSIQAALDVQRNGEVVRILDKGPYKESLRWENKRDCGLVSTVGTIIEATGLLKGLQTQENAEQWIFRTSASRIHGFTFIANSIAQSTQEQKNTLTALRIQDCDGICIEHCAFVKRELPQATRKVGVGIYNALAESTDTRGQCIRNCVFAKDFIGLNAVAGQTFLSQNWIRVHLERPSQGYFGLTVSAHSKKDTVHVRRNIFDASAFGHMVGAFGNINRQDETIRLSYNQNTHVAAAGKLLFIAGKMDEATEFKNNFSLARNPSVHIESYLGNEVRDAALRLWKIEGNFSRLRNSRYGVPLANIISPDATLISFDPHDRNFMRIDPTKITVSKGDPFPGALPPGPAPPEGDWFTELQDRFKDALQYMTPEAREFWSKPLELPTADNEQSSSRDATTAQATASTTEPPNPTSDEAASTQTTEVKAETSDDNPTPSEPQAKADDAEVQKTEEPKQYAKAVRFNNDTKELEITQRDYPPELERLKQAPDFLKAFESAESRYSTHERQRDLTQPPGFLIFGRVVSEDSSIDPSQIEAIFSVDSNGYFVDFIPWADTPIAFGLHAHQAIEVKPQGPPEPRTACFAEDLGTITLRKVERRELATLKGRVQLQGSNGRPIAGVAEVSLNVIPHVDGDPDRPIGPRLPRDGERLTLRPSVAANGTFTIPGLSPEPTTYRVTATRRGYLPATEDVRLKPGTRNPTASLTLEESIPVIIETVRWTNEAYDLNQKNTAELFGGDRFTPDRKQFSAQLAKVGGQMGGISSSEMYYGIRRIHQHERKLSFEFTNQQGPILTGCKDLGMGTLDDFSKINPRDKVDYEARDLELKHGHVYLLRSLVGVTLFDANQLTDSSRNTIRGYSHFTLARVTFPSADGVR